MEVDVMNKIFKLIGKNKNVPFVDEWAELFGKRFLLSIQKYNLRLLQVHHKILADHPH